MLTPEQLRDPNCQIHQAALSTIMPLWPIIRQLVSVHPHLANSMRAALPPSLQGVPNVPARAPVPRVDRILLFIKKHQLTLGAFLCLVLDNAPDGRSRTALHAGMVSRFLGGRTPIPADEIVSLMYEHRDSAPKQTRGNSRAALQQRSGAHMARARILKWAERTIRGRVKQEMGVLVDPEISDLRPPKTLTWDSLNKCTMEHFSRPIRRDAPILFRMLIAVATTTKKELRIEPDLARGSAASVIALPQGRGRSKRDPQVVVTCGILMLAVSRAVRANLFQRFVGAWLWSVCAPAALYSVLSRAGLSVSYPTVLRFLRELARNGIRELHTLLSLVLWIVIYDNVNRRHRIWKEKLGEVWEQLNGTAHTVFTTEAVDKSILDLAPVEQARSENRRAALTVNRIRDEIDFTHQRSIMAHHCLLFLVTWLRPLLGEHEKRILTTFRTTLSKHRIPPGRKSGVYSLGTSAFNEATVRGTKDVLDDVFLRQLARKPEELVQRMQVVGGDQLTVVRVRSLQNYMSTCPHGHASLKWVQPLALTWHMGWADLARLIKTHFGSGGSGDPSSYHHVNVLLKRRVKDEDRPDFYPALRLISETLKADVLNCWMLVLGTDNLSSHFQANHISYEALEEKAYQVVDQYFSLAVAECAERGAGSALAKFEVGRPWKRPTARANDSVDSPSSVSPDIDALATSNIPENFNGDQTLANGIRRRHDAVLQYEFQFAIADGDFGRAWQVIMAWASTFAGSGHLKYLDEVLEMFCLFIYELPERTIRFIWENSIGSLTGHDGSYVPLDLIQEWLIGEIKAHMARSDEAFDAAFAREVVAPNVRGALDCKKAMRAMFGLAATATHHSNSLDDECVARILRDIHDSELSKFRRGRHYGHVAQDDEAVGYNVMEKGKIRSFLSRTCAADARQPAEVDDSAPTSSADAPMPEPDLSGLVEGVLNGALVEEDDDIWDGFDD